MDFKWYDPRGWFEATAEQRKNKIIDPEPKVLINYRDIGSVPFGGVKTPGGLGPAIKYNADNAELRVRSWQAMMESDFAQIGMNAHVTWTIGTGLTYQSEPAMRVLASNGITIDKQKFTKELEEQWELFCEDPSSDYAGMKNLYEQSAEGELNAAVGGDVLVILRVLNGDLKVQLIDGGHVESPTYGSEGFPQALPDGNLIIDGVEINSKKQHVAIWVRTYAVEKTIQNFYNLKYQRIPTYGDKSGFLMTYLYSMRGFRLDGTRGMSLIGACLEKLDNMESYSDSTLQQAKSSANIDYQLIRESGANGPAPWANNLAQRVNGQGGTDNDQNPVTDDRVEKLKRVKIDAKGTAIDNPPGAKIEVIANKNPLYFKDFYMTHGDVYCAVIQIPPDVAMNSYGQSYSASRAAVMGYKFILQTKRKRHTKFLNPIKDLWLHLKILKGDIQAPGYIIAYKEGNDAVLKAYRKGRFIGQDPPHVDPKAEAEAARILLGAAGANMPIGTQERVTEDLGKGDADENNEQFAEELNTVKKLGIKPDPIVQQVLKNTTKNTTKEAPVKKKAPAPVKKKKLPPIKKK